MKFKKNNSNRNNMKITYGEITEKVTRNGNNILNNYENNMKNAQEKTT